MDKLLLQSNNIKKKKSEKETNSNKKDKKLSILNDYSIKKCGTGILKNQNAYHNIELLLSKNNKAFLNPNILTKKENLENNFIKSNSLTNSNILLKSTEENLIENINNSNNKNIIPKKSMINMKNSTLNGDSENSKLERTFLKNAINFFQKVLLKEKELNEQVEKKSNCSTKIISSKLLEDIEKEKNKIVSKQIRNSAMLSSNHKIGNSKTNSFFKFGEITKKKSQQLEKPIIKKKDRRLSIFSKREFLKIKSLQRMSSEISRKIRKSSIKEVKEELKKFETLEITEMIDKIPRKIENKPSRRKSLTDSNITFDAMKMKEKIREEEYQNKFRNLFICNNLFDSLDDEENEDLEKSNVLCIRPNDISCYIIDSLTLLASFINIIYIPYFLAFMQSNCKYNFLSGDFILFMLMELIYIIDLFSGFFRAYYNFEEVLIIKKRYMCLNYLKGNFIFDLIEAIPFFLILNLGQENCNANNFNNFAFNNHLNYSFLLLKLLKIFKVFNNSAVKAIGKLLNKSDFFSDWKAVLANIIIVICSLHIACCYFIFLGNNKNPGWSFILIKSESGWDIYIASLYYVVTTLTTVGYGDITGISDHEKFFQIILLIVGTFSYSWLLTYISNYIKKNHDKYIIYEEKVKILDEIKLNYPNLSTNLYERISRYLRYNKSKYKYNIKYLLDSLPCSIQNNLIIEIYKPIIKNFLFFKYFENSDFFVKIVTSMKPILSMKDDVLINEGDVVEDIIFIKKGVLSLEIGINLDEPKKYAEEHLKVTTHTNQNKHENLTYFQTIPTRMKESSNIFLNYTTKKTKNIEEKKVNVKQVRIIDLRTNEHFGDVLMILNEKSPVTIRVKSKKAELLFLQKTNATEISNLYPNIWKRIVNKSLHNLNEIKNIIRKKIIFYCEANDIPISPNLKTTVLNKKVKFKSNISDKKIKTGPKKYIKSIIKEEDESKYTSRKNSSLSKKTIIKNNSSLKSKNNNNEKDNKSNLGSTAIFKKYKTKKTIISHNSEKNNKSNSELISGSKPNNINDNSFYNERKNKSEIRTSEINDKNSEIISERLNMNQSHEEKNSEKINEEIFFNEDLGTNIINKHIIMNNYDKNNYIFHQRTDENSDYLISLNNSYDKINKLLGENSLSQINLENVLIENNSVNSDKRNKKINIYNNIVINNSHKNDNIINENYKKINKFEILENSSINSFTIYSSYENLNQISKYKYASNKTLHQKVKNLIQQNTFKKFKTIQSLKDNKPPLLKEETNFIKNNKNINYSAEKIRPEKSSSNGFLIIHKFNSTIEDKENTSFKRKEKEKRHFSSNNVSDGENTFYSRMKIINRSKITGKLRDKNKKLNNYQDIISKNIEENKQNLNNPEEYFSGFFNNILSKKKI